MNKQIIWKVFLLKKGITQAQIAREIGVCKSLVSMTIAGKRKNCKVLEYLNALIKQ